MLYNIPQRVVQKWYNIPQRVVEKWYNIPHRVVEKWYNIPHFVVSVVCCSRLVAASFCFVAQNCLYLVVSAYGIPLISCNIDQHLICILLFLKN